MNNTTISEWCTETEQLVHEAESISRRLQQRIRPPATKNLDTEDVRAMAEAYTRFMGRWEDIPSATRRLKSAGESLANVGPEALASRLRGILDALRPTLDNAPDLPKKADCVLTGWFQGGIGYLDARRSDGGTTSVVTGHVDLLPEGHWARSILPEDELYRGSTLMLVLGPVINGRPSPIYPTQWVVHYTRRYRGPQAEQERLAAERAQQEREQARLQREADPAWQMRQLQERVAQIEAENRELKAKLETTNGGN